MMKHTPLFTRWHWVLLLIGIAIFVRLASLAMFPLMDTTEARYGEMARIMVETGNWVTPMFDYNVPFWGKPPLFAWLSAVGFSVFGINEFAARFPHLLIGVLTLVPVFYLAKSLLNSRKAAWMALAILMTTCGYLVTAGAVMTDMALTLSMTLALICFWFNWQQNDDNQHKIYGYGFFAALALGMLAKGPLILVLVGLSLVPWLTFNKLWQHVWRKLPWIKGSLLFFALTLPWYIAAEIATPGFLQYFIIGEHFQRFLVPGWEGDLYGSAHDQPKGMIWLFWLATALPWSPILIWQACKHGRLSARNANLYPNQQSFLWCWLVSPMVLFTFAGNILPAYVVPGLPAMAILLCLYCMKSEDKSAEQTFEQNPYSSHWLKVGLITPVIALVAALYIGLGFSGKTADKDLMASWTAQTEAGQSELLYFGKKPFSGQFYSSGKAQKITDIDAIDEQAFVVIRKHQQQALTESDGLDCQARASNRKRVLFFCQPNANSALAKSENSMQKANTDS
ncbi:ArnT family glycosyltransferase [Motilimonas pumila]|uniref:Glycosyltransferase family 39 protein n=1 Tax=Motilimonas pumila TaxID=2303987 RepID=A0A418YBC0_9GAMM|nr:glycosyltransferase family 39 protein [Motilimonas pumila]RJG40284.1 glycosyltransferase family 39 protein [Motilimonas pumila]